MKLFAILSIALQGKEQVTETRGPPLSFAENATSTYPAPGNIRSMTGSEKSSSADRVSTTTMSLTAELGS